MAVIEVVGRTARQNARRSVEQYVGLDAKGTRIGYALWHGEELEETMRRRVAGLF